MNSRSSQRGARVVLGLALVVAALVPALYGEPPQDDAYISYVYARNLARGAGLVFNAGEPAVEGYSNFLWTVLLAGAQAVGVGPARLAPWLGLLLTVAIVAVLWALARRLGASAWYAALAALYFAALPTLRIHAMSGLETALFAFLVAAALLIRTEEASEGFHWRSSLVLVLAALTRPEGVLVWALVEASELLVAWARGGDLLARLRRAVVGSTPFWVLVIAHLVWRRVTYGDWVPNTFHAKVGGGDLWTTGAQYVLEGVVCFGLVFVVAPYFLPPRRGGARPASWSACLTLGAAFPLYVVAVGGDYVPGHRFLWPVLPLWCAVLAVALTDLGERLDGATVRRRLSACFVVLAAAQIAFTAVEAPPWPAQHERHRQLVAAGRALDRILPPDAWLATTNAGRVTYFADRRTIDMMGLSDRHIARQPAAESALDLAGHLKGDGAYVLDRRPEVILLLRLIVTGEPLEARPGWLERARRAAFGPSEEQLVADRRFTRDYRLTSLPLPEVDGHLNLFVRRDVALGH